MSQRLPPRRAVAAHDSLSSTAHSSEPPSIPSCDRAFPRATVHSRSRQPSRVWRLRSVTSFRRSARGHRAEQGRQVRHVIPLRTDRPRHTIHPASGPVARGLAPQRTGLPNKRMQLTKLRAAPERQAEVPPCAPAARMDGGTASQLIRSVRWTRRGEPLNGIRPRISRLTNVAHDGMTQLTNVAHFGHSASDCAARRLQDVARKMAGAAPSRPAGRERRSGSRCSCSRRAPSAAQDTTMLLLSGHGRWSTLGGQLRGRLCYTRLVVATRHRTSGCS